MVFGVINGRILRTSRRMKKKIRRVFRSIRGKSLSRQLFVEDNALYITFGEDIGSAVFPLCYLNCLREKYHGSSIIIISKEKYKGLINLFIDGEELIVLSDSQYETLCFFLTTYWGNKLQKQKRVYYFYNNIERTQVFNWAFSNNDLFKNVCTQNLLYSYAFKVGILKSITYGKPNNTNDDEFNKFINEYGVAANNTVILIPYTRSGDLLPSIFWCRLAEKMKSKGVLVFTNTSYTDEVIPGTKQLFCPIEFIPRIVNYAGYCVTIQTGLGDLIRHCQCKCTLIENYGPKYIMSNFDTLRINYTKPVNYYEAVKALPMIEKNRHNSKLVGIDPFVFDNTYADIYDTDEKLENLLNNVLQNIGKALGLQFE